MSFRLTPVFIQSNTPFTEEEVLQAAGLPSLQKGKAIAFYETSKQYDRVFMGRNSHCTIVCNGNLAYAAFDDHYPLAQLQNAEITAIIWDETSGCFGFSYIKNGETIRKVMVVDGSIECDEGEPLAEETTINEEDLFPEDEREEMIEAEGEEGFLELLKAEKICRATNLLAKRFLGTGMMELQEQMELYEYH
ncbi:MAG TPA: hypothetical protein VFV46_08155 [Lacibacter sp.]|nr:hypothetical protein [Lacibacter sp.]